MENNTVYRVEKKQQLQMEFTMPKAHANKEIDACATDSRSRPAANILHATHSFVLLFQTEGSFQLEAARWKKIGKKIENKKINCW